VVGGSPCAAADLFITRDNARAAAIYNRERSEVA
jgi:hypothetical protein